jgi:hypothetical protein
MTRLSDDRYGREVWQQEAGELRVYIVLEDALETLRVTFDSRVPVDSVYRTIEAMSPLIPPVPPEE